MKVNNIIIYLSIVFVACSTNDSDENNELSNRPEILNVSPAKVEIGDTIRVTGKNLDIITRMVFFNEKQNHPNDQPFVAEKSRFITYRQNEIALEMPWFFHEQVTIDFKNLYVTNWDIELKGMIPILHDFQKIQEIKVVNQDIAYLIDDNNVYKSIDGFHNWTSIFEGQVTALHFINESTGWVVTGWDGTADIYRTEDGGDSFDLVYSFSLPGNSSFVRKIHFTSGFQGYFVTNEPQMYKIENDLFRNIFDVYPNLNEQGFANDKIWNFTIVNDGLMFLLTNSGSDPLIKINNQDIILNQFEAAQFTPPQLISNIGYHFTEKDLYKSFDQGTTWNKISSFENYLQHVQFIDEQLGFAYIGNKPGAPHLLKTTDGGVSWTNFYEFPGFGTGHYQGDLQDFSTVNGLIGGRRSLFKFKQ